ncbi:hypothetical protein GGR50DRAFT_387787 [Xylaria sp. CBS 124048]|nr:hypothetical protein GGR50DRAFT_387787 [Xylaria sp. CBS 124048]
MEFSPTMFPRSPPVGDAARVLLLLLTTWVSLFVITTAQMLPYIPTTIFLPAPKPGSTKDNATGSIAYILTPQGDSVDLLTLNASTTLVASSLSFNTLSSSLPFLQNSSTAFVPSIADNGSLLVYAGDCSTSTDAGIWSLDLSTSNSSSSQWTRGEIRPATDSTWIQMGPGFLGTAFTFSTTLAPQISPINTFVYGGMCPNASTADPTTPQSDAQYSNQMLKISQSTIGSEDYTIQPVDSDGPPIPEAGFTFTGLAPSFTNRSGAITQQRDYVLLGGHTQYAFINMSTVAIWSLPLESWSFVSDIGVVGSGSGNSELATEDSFDSVDSRSGHTAVLNEDGTALIILGGWVGDLTQAAFPQLAVLQVGWDHGGIGEWQWTIPDAQLPGGGIYGHGATLLPGNVMMVYGGYTIPSEGNNKRQASGSTASFLNLTSMTWIDEYTNPAYAKTSADGNTPGSNNSRKQKLGLELGLSIGLGLLLTVIAIFACRRLRRKRRSRDAAIRALSQDNSRFIGHDELTGDYDQGTNWYMGGADPYGQGDRSLGYQSLQTDRASMENSRQNWFGDMPPAPPPMSQINRKSIAPRAAKGQHQPTSSVAYEPMSSPRGLPSMNPIFEADEDDAGDIGDEAMSPARDGRRDSGAYSDPFATPTRERPVSFPGPSHSSQTSSPEERNRVSVTDPEVQDWMTDMDAADALLSRHASTSRAPAPVGRSSSRRGHNAANDEEFSRTDSNISESNRADLSRSGSILRHLRPGFGAAVAAALAATTEGRGGSSGSSSTPSYNTARSSFLALQAEGPSLLMGRGGQRGENAEDEPQEPGSPSKSKPLRRGWLGSLRRALTGQHAGPSDFRTVGEDSQVPDGVVGTNDFEARPGGLGSIGGIAADVLSRRKSGRKAWESQEASPSQTVTRYTPLEREKADGEPTDDEEWDVEKAVEKRLVQFMFTVPKEPLRVVNAEPDLDSDRDIISTGPEIRIDGERGVPNRMSRQRSSLSQEVTRQLDSPIRLSPSPLSDDDERTTDSNDARIKASTEALRRELDEEWERIEAGDTILEAPEPLRLRPQSQASAFSSQRSESQTPELEVPRLPPLLHHSNFPHASRPSQALSSLTLEEQIHLLGTELHQARSAAQTPLSQTSHHSDADVLSAQVVRFERFSGSRGTLQITPVLTNARGPRLSAPKLRVTETPKLETPKTTTPDTDFRSESNLRGASELRPSGNNTPSRRVRAMVQEFESKSSREASPAGSQVKSTPTRGSPTKGR